MDTVHSEVQSIIKKLVTTPIDSERLEMVKASMLSSLYMSIESSGGLNSMLALAYIKGDRKGDILERRAQEIKDTTIEDIQSMAKETFDTPGFKATLTPN